MNFLLLVAVFATAAYGGVTDPKNFKLPEGTPTCEHPSPDLNECLKNAFNEMIPKLHRGSDDLSIPAIDPFIIGDNRFDYNNGALQGILGLKNVKTYGMSNTVVKAVRFNIDDAGTETEVDIHIPRVFIEGQYKGLIKINDFKMNPKGYFNITMSDINATQKSTGSFEVRDGVRYIRLTAFDVEPNVGDMKIFATNLFPSPEMNDIALNFINQYWEAIYRMMLPETKARWEPIILEAANKFTLNVPFDVLIKMKKDE